MDLDLTIGLTGGIGAGKSVVARVLRCNRFVVYDCDSRAKDLMVMDPELKEELISEIGGMIYEPDGTLNKTEMRRVIFSNDQARKKVNRMVHAAVKKDILQHRKKVKGILFIESAIIFTGGIADFCDTIWVVNSPLQNRIERIEKRDQLPKQEIESRISAQDEELKLLKESKDKSNIIILENDNNRPILMQILKMTNTLNNLNTYSYYVERNIINHR